RGQRARAIVERMVVVEHRLRHCPVEQARIEMAQAEMIRQPPGDGAFAGGGRAVDGDDHCRFAPSARSMSTKPGKLVAMKPVSSPVTGWSAAGPMTRTAMAYGDPCE